jgi:hypothetical protein
VTIELEPFAAITPTTATVACVEDIVVPTPPVVTDNCGNELTPVAGTAPVAPVCEGDMVYTWVYTDCEGNQQTYTHTVTIELADFLVNMPDNKRLQVKCSSEAVQPVPPVVTDLCGNTLTPTGPVKGGTYTDCEGTITYTWTYKDCTETSHDWVFTYDVEVEDFAAHMPANTGSKVACASEAVEPLPPVVTDNCGNDIIPSGPATGGQFDGCQGTISYTYTYADCEGNTHSWTHTYTVEAQPLAPIAGTTETVACVADIEMPLLPEVTDHCGNVLTPVVGEAPVAPDCEGQMVYSWLYTDCAGNQQTYTHTVTITYEDFTMPANTMTTVACVDDIVVPDPPKVTDHCGNALVAVAGKVPGVPACGESVVYAWTYEDCAGFVHTYTHTVTLQDNEFPVITCPANISLVLPSGSTSTTVTIVPATATDNCRAEVEGVRGDGKALTDPYPLGVTSILWSATDDCGNVSTCTSTVTITDRSVVSGTVFHDTNRMTDNTVNGTGVNPEGLLYANLVDNAGNVTDAMKVNIDGTYSFDNVPAGDYTVQITVNQGVTGSAMPVTKLPLHWINTGEHLGAGTGSDGTTDGLLSISVDGDDNVKEANFGIVKLPDLTPTLTATKNVMNGITTFDLIIRITEINNVNSNGLITVRVPKDSRLTFDPSFNPALTVLSGVQVNNADWSYDGTDPNNHVFTTSKVIGAASFSTIGVRLRFDPQNARGSYTITSQLQSGSGGESRVNNNADAEKLDYFPK